MTTTVDDDRLPYALYGLIDAMGLWRAGTLQTIAMTGGLLTGDLEPPDGEDLPTAGGGTWTQFIGRIGAVALRAAAPSTREERRERLLAFLETWAATPFADPEAPLRLGVAETEHWTARDEHGTAVAVYWDFGNWSRRRFVDLRRGEGTPPALGPISEIEDVPRGWGGPGQLRALVGLVRERGPMPWDPAAVKALAGGTGMSRAAAALTLAGIPGTNSYSKPFLDAGERSVLKIKTAEAADVLTELGGLGTLGRLDLLANVLPADPAELWEPGGALALAERIAEAWRRRYGRRPSVPEKTLNAAMKVSGSSLSAADICAVFADPRSEARLTRDVDTSLEETDYGLWAGGEGQRRFVEVLNALPRLVRWAYAELPAGDPVRGGVPEAVALVRERLSHPGLILDAGALSSIGNTIAALQQKFGTVPYPLLPGYPTADDGLSIAAPAKRGLIPHVFFRPALYDGTDQRARLLSAEPLFTDQSLRAFEWLRDGLCDRIVERIGSGGLPDGRYEPDPLAVVPDLVARVAERHGLTEDAARLYLQLLALPAPTDGDVRKWNAWKAPRHEQAETDLVDASLVVRGHRPRAGRTVFLPGGWAAAKKAKPLETWKADLLGVKLSDDRSKVETDTVDLPLTLPDLFAQAWQRVEDGDGPRRIA
ncbi:hypothetical protein [Actinomadura rugatobispora]|uniref:DNA-binding protein n=1 Tax=Actinomadura rugatobispora TaxID=1994 RepID=A0ABW1A6X3_9ACTN|nr:hypothetical protein GCM10010200_004760 [Actinomadura rugatobispora]